MLKELEETFRFSKIIPDEIGFKRWRFYFTDDRGPIQYFSKKVTIFEACLLTSLTS
jgi:hypothetical protein